MKSPKIFWGGAVPPPQKILGLFHLKWLILVQIPLYILTKMLLYLPLGPRYCLILRGPVTADIPRNSSESLNGWSEALTLTVGLQ